MTNFICTFFKSNFFPFCDLIIINILILFFFTIFNFTINFNESFLNFLFPIITFLLFCFCRINFKTAGFCWIKIVLKFCKFTFHKPNFDFLILFKYLSIGLYPTNKIWLFESRFFKFLIIYFIIPEFKTF